MYHINNGRNPRVSPGSKSPISGYVPVTHTALWMDRFSAGTGELGWSHDSLISIASASVPSGADAIVPRTHGSTNSGGHHRIAPSVARGA